MVRQLLVPALLAVLCAPDWATAFDPCVCPTPVVVTHCPPVYGVIVHGPVIHCPPATGTVAPTQGPTIVPERMDPPKKAPVVTEPNPIKPVAVEPKPEVKQVVPPTDRIPPPAVPPAPPSSKPDLGKLDFDIPPIGDVPLAKPQPAPSDTPKKPADAPKPPEKLPEFNFDLPKVEGGGGVAQPVEANKKTVANSSPLSDAAVVDVYPRDGKNVLTAKRGVTFVNKSARDILLTVDGQTVTLPSKTVMAAELPAAFKWQIGGEAERSEKVPDGSPGVDVVIRK